MTLRSVLWAVFSSRGGCVGAIGFSRKRLEQIVTTTTAWRSAEGFRVPEAEENGDSGMSRCGLVCWSHRRTESVCTDFTRAFTALRFCVGAVGSSPVDVVYVLGNSRWHHSDIFTRAFVALFAMLVAITLVGGVKWYKVAWACLIGALVVMVAEPDYVVP